MREKMRFTPPHEILGRVTKSDWPGYKINRIILERTQMLPALAQIRPNLSIDLPHIIWRSAAARPLVITREDAFARLRMVGAVRFIGYEEAMAEIEAGALGELPAVPFNA
jgi:hypothetical protein